MQKWKRRAWCSPPLFFYADFWLVIGFQHTLALTYIFSNVSEANKWVGLWVLLELAQKGHLGEEAAEPLNSIVLQRALRQTETHHFIISSEAKAKFRHQLHPGWMNDKIAFQLSNFYTLSVSLLSLLTQMNKTYSNSKRERHLTSLRQIAETSAGSRLLLLILKRKSSCFLGNIWVTYNSMNHYKKKRIFSEKHHCTWMS